MKKIFSFFIILTLLCAFPKGSFAEGQYSKISIKSISNLSLHDDYANFPLGNVEFNSIPFYIPETGKNFLATRNIACLSCPNQGYISGLSITQPKTLYLLVNSSDTFTPRYSNVNFGSVYLLFLGGEEYKYDFITGNNVREWLESGNYGATVNTVTSIFSKEIWRGYRPNGEYPVVTDLLKVPVPPQFNNKILTGVFLYDDSVNRINSEEPGLIVKGLTIEQGINQPSTSFSLSTDWDGSNRQVPIDRNAKITVKVVDQDSNPLSGVSVAGEVLNSGAGSLDRATAVTNDSGEVFFFYTPTLAVPTHLAFIVNGEEKRLDFEVYRPPVVIVPGMGASLNLPKFLHNVPFSDAFWGWSPTAGQGWDEMIQTLENNGYSYNSNYTIAFYDWRKTLDPSRYASGHPPALEESIEPAVARMLQNRPAGQRVNILAHSYGGVVSRAYMAFDAQNTVNRYITLATPHQGSSNIFWTWYGGEMPPAGDPMFRIVTDAILQIYKHKNIVGDVQQVRDQFSGFLNILPTYDRYVRSPTTVFRTYNLTYKNDVLNNYYTLNGLNTLILNRNIKFTSFYATGEPTLRDVSVAEKIPGATVWVDGKPLDTQNYVAGDNSVLPESAIVSPFDSIQLHGGHGDVPDLAVNDVKGLLKIGGAVVPGKGAAKNMLAALMLSPATVDIVSPEGNVLATSEMWDEEEGTKFAHAEDLTPGVYGLTVTGTGTGNYTLYVPFAGPQSYWSTTFTGDITPGEVEKYSIFVPTAPGSKGSVAVETNGRLRIGSLNIPQRQLPISFIFDLPPSFPVDQLQREQLFVQDAYVPILSSELSRSERRLTVEVNAADVGSIVNWDENDVILRVVAPGTEQSLFSKVHMRLNWGMYRKFF